MKKIIFFLFSVLVLSGLGSCKKCATCTYNNGTSDVSEFCGRGKTYQDQFDKHEKSGWTCRED